VTYRHHSITSSVKVNGLTRGIMSSRALGHQPRAMRRLGTSESSHDTTSQMDSGQAGIP